MNQKTIDILIPGLILGSLGIGYLFFIVLHLSSYFTVIPAGMFFFALGLHRSEVKRNQKKR